MATAAFETLGCKLNFSETSSIRRQFSEQGFRIVDFEEMADIYVINTCSVTNDANSSCRKTVRRALRNNPDAFVAVIGCYAQLEPKEIASIDGVDAVLGASEKFQLLELFDDFTKQTETVIHRSDVNEAVEFHNAISSDDRTRAFLKVQDGCNYKCSFCTIPLARGKSRSPHISTVVRQARQLVHEGYKEIVVTGVNAGDFGRGRSDSFLDLMHALNEVDGLHRIRVSSIEPNLLEPGLIELAAASDKIQPHFHMPLQSGSDELLRLMRRRYRTSLYRERVEFIRSLLPDASIGVDVITGHPGETAAHAEETLQFIDSLPVSYLHVFTYSERPNTHALTLEPVIPVPERKRRTHQLRRLSKEKQFEFARTFEGSTRPVLLESDEQNDLIRGCTDNYIRVELPFRTELQNRIIPVQLVETGTNGVVSGQIGEEIMHEEKLMTTLAG